MTTLTKGHSHGRRSTGYMCPILETWINRNVPAMHRETYVEAVTLIDSLIPHHGERTNAVSHGMPSQDDLYRIIEIQDALSELTGIEFDTTKLFRYLDKWNAHMEEMDSLDV